MKTYKFPSKQVGTTTGEVEKTLAAPTTNRMDGLLGLFGFKSFAEMFAPDKMISGMVARLDLAIDQKKLKKALEICLVEGCEDVDFVNLDLRISDGVIQDFFEQRTRSFAERMKSSLEM
jgi:hypothetical protein